MASNIPNEHVGDSSSPVLTHEHLARVQEYNALTPAIADRLRDTPVNVGPVSRIPKSIYVKMPNFTTIHLAVLPTATLGQIKNVIRRRQGFKPALGIALRYSDKTITAYADDDTLFSRFFIPNHSVLELGFRMLSCAPPNGCVDACMPRLVDDRGQDPMNFWQGVDPLDHIVISIHNIKREELMIRVPNSIPLARLRWAVMRYIGTAYRSSDCALIVNGKKMGRFNSRGPGEELRLLHQCGIVDQSVVWTKQEKAGSAPGGTAVRCLPAPKS